MPRWKCFSELSTALPSSILSLSVYKGSMNKRTDVPKFLCCFSLKIVWIRNKEVHPRAMNTWNGITVERLWRSNIKKRTVYLYGLNRNHKQSVRFTNDLFKPQPEAYGELEPRTHTLIITGSHVGILVFSLETYHMRGSYLAPHIYSRLCVYSIYKQRQG